jgi:hypothetical protein
MLASTVQFSRYGRIRLRARRLSVSADGSSCRRSGSVHRLAVVPRGCGSRPVPQDPTACQAAFPSPAAFQSGEPDVLATAEDDGQLVDVPPLSNHPGTYVQVVALEAGEPAPDAP